MIKGEKDKMARTIWVGKKKKFYLREKPNTHEATTEGAGGGVGTEGKKELYQ